MVEKGSHKKTPKVKAKILEAALALWSSSDSESLTIGNIQKKSGVSIGSLYHHFKDKDDILLTLYLEGLKRYQEGILTTLKASLDAETGIKSVVIWHLDWVRQNPQWKSFLMEDSRQPSKEFLDNQQAINAEFYQGLDAWMRPLVKAGQMKDLPWDLLSALVLGPAQTYSRHWLAGRSVSPLPEAKAVFSQAAWRAVRVKKGKK